MKGESTRRRVNLIARNSEVGEQNIGTNAKLGCHRCHRSKIRMNPLNPRVWRGTSGAFHCMMQVVLVAVEEDDNARVHRCRQGTCMSASACGCIDDAVSALRRGHFHHGGEQDRFMSVPTIMIICSVPGSAAHHAS
jgi:hypothetical protein